MANIGCFLNLKAQASIADKFCSATASGCDASTALSMPGGGKCLESRGRNRTIVMVLATLAML